MRPDRLGQRDLLRGIEERDVGNAWEGELKLGLHAEASGDTG